MPKRAYRFRFYPNAIQRRMLARMFGTGRWVWNQCLSWRTTAYRQDGESLTGLDFSRELTFLKTLESYAWLREVPATIATQALRDQDRAFRAFLRGDARYPRYMSRRGPQSVRLQLDQRVVAGNYRAGELLRLPGLGACKLSWSRKPQGTPKMVTVRRDAAGRYWVSMAIEETIEALAPAPTSIGIDLGTTRLATLSTGERLDNPRHLRRHAEHQARLQQRLARQCKGSKRRAATQQRIARQLAYKAEWYGRTLVKVDQFYPSSKICSGCGHRLEELPLSVRHWRCPACGAEHDRDENAARNIEREGLRLLEHPEESGGVRAFGGEGACPVAVSARIAQAPSLGREPG